MRGSNGASSACEAGPSGSLRVNSGVPALQNDLMAIMQ